VADRALTLKILGDAKGATDAMDKVAEKGNFLKEHAKAIAGVLGGAFAVGAIADFGKHAVSAFQETGSQAASLKRLLGGTAEEASRLNFAAEETGVSTDSMATSLKKFSKAVEGGTDAEKKQFDALAKKNEGLEKTRAKLEALKHPTAAQRQQLLDLTKTIGENDGAMGELGVGMEKLGFSTVDAKGDLLSMHQQLLVVADKFKSMPDGMEKNALAMKLFGKAGTDMLPFLNRGAAGIADLEKQSDKFGLTLNQKQLDALKKNKEATREMHAAMKGLMVHIGSELFPVVTKITGWLAENMPGAMHKIGAVIDSVLRPAMTWFSGHWDKISATLHEVADWIESNVIPVVADLASWLGEHLVAAVKLIAEKIAEFSIWINKHREYIIALGIGIAAGLVTALYLWATAATEAAAATGIAMAPVIAIGAAIAALAAGVIYAYHHFQTFHDVVDAVGRFFRDTVWPILKDIGSWITDTFVPALVSIGTFFYNAGQTIYHTVQDVVGWFEGVPDKIGGFFSRVGGLITGPFKAAFNAVATVWNSTVGALSFHIPSWVPVIGGDGFSMPKIPLFHRGGEVGPGLPTGTEVLAILQAGERVTPIGAAGAGGGNVYNFTGIVNEQALALAVVRETDWARRTAAR